MYTSEAIKPQHPVREVYEGTAANSPADVTDDLFVIALQFEDEGDIPHRHGPLYGWDANHGGALPVEGDRILFTVSDLGNYWCVAWSNET
jgi:hypothetical protein